MLIRFLMVAALFLAAHSGTAQDSAVRRVQTKLTEVGCYDGRIDGASSLKLRTAIRCFQRSIGEFPTGELSQNDRIALMTDGAPAVEAAPAPAYDPQDNQPTRQTLVEATDERAEDELARNTRLYQEELSQRWRSVRDTPGWNRRDGEQRYGFGDGICDVAPGSGQEVILCRRYLVDTGPPDSFVACAMGGPGRTPDRIPAQCRSLPASLCNRVGGLIDDTAGRCTLQQDLDDPDRGRIGYRAVASELFEWRLVAGAQALAHRREWPQDYDGRAALDAERKMLLEAEYAMILASRPDEENADVMARARFAAGRGLSCSWVLKHDQLDGILAGRVSGGDPNTVLGFCRNAVECAWKSHLDAGPGEPRRVALAALESPLCSAIEPNRFLYAIWGNQTENRRAFLDRFARIKQREGLTWILGSEADDLDKAARRLAALDARDVSHAFVFDLDERAGPGVSLNALRLHLARQAVADTGIDPLEFARELNR